MSKAPYPSPSNRGGRLDGNQLHSSAAPDAKNATFRLSFSLGLTLVFVAIEAAAGFFAHSLALLTDSAHNLTDAVAIALSVYAVRLTTRPAHSGKTFGYHRAGILVALVNSTTLVLIALGIFYEAYRRFRNPPEVQAGILIVVGLAAFFINLFTARLVKQGSSQDLNIRSTYVHLMGDAISTLGAVLAGAAIALTGLVWLDSLVSVLIAFLILWNARDILRDTVRILLESTPADVDIEKLVCDLLRIPGVEGVHDLHVWSITQGLRVLSAHIVTRDMPVRDGAVIHRDVDEVLKRQYNISHSTLQLECEGCTPDSLYCNLNTSDSANNNMDIYNKTTGE